MCCVRHPIWNVFEGFFLEVKDAHPHPRCHISSCRNKYLLKPQELSKPRKSMISLFPTNTQIDVFMSFYIASCWTEVYYWFEVGLYNPKGSFFHKKKEGKKPNLLQWEWSRRSGPAPVMEGLGARLEGALSSAPGSTKSQRTFLTNLCLANTYRPPGTGIS